MKIGTAVHWKSWILGREVDRYGYVFFEVPAYTDPRAFIPQGYNFTSKSETRPVKSYLLHVPGVKVVYWPETFGILDDRDKGKIYTQPLPQAVVKNRVKPFTWDRDIIKENWKNLGVEFVERPQFLTCVEAGLRLWFKVDPETNAEYISQVEKFSL